MRNRTTFNELVQDEFKMYGSSVAIYSNGKEVSYSDLIEGSKKIGATLLRDVDPNVSVRMALCLSKKAELCYSFYGVVTVGFSAMILSDELSSTQIKNCLKKYKTGAIILDSITMLRFEEELKEYNEPVFLISADESLHFYNVTNRQGFKSNAHKHNINSDTEAVVLFSSGTTGEQKGVSISHANLIKTSDMVNSYMEIDSPIVDFVTSPLYQAFGLRRVISHHISGSAVVLEDGVINPAKVLKLLNDIPCSGISGVPSVFKLLDAAYGDFLSKIGPKLKYVLLSAAPLSKKEKEYLSKIFPNAHLCMYYGLTEAAISIFLHFFKDKEKLHTIGTPAPGVLVKIVDDNGIKVDNGCSGEIIIKGFNVANGYLFNPELTNKKFVEGWFLTSDIGRLDDEGYIELLGRKDEMINVGGKKMYPTEIENFIKINYPSLDSAIISISHKYLGEIPVFCYAKDVPVDEDLFRKLTSDIKSHFENYKVPVQKYELPEIPKTGNGKIQRFVLKEMLKSASQ